MTNQQQNTQTRYLKIKRSDSCYRPSRTLPAEQLRPAERLLNLHFVAPTTEREASDEELGAARELRDRLATFSFVKEACRCQDERTVGVKFKVAGPAVNFDQLLTRVFLDLREVEGTELLTRPGARWRASYENGSLADEGEFDPRTITARRAEA